MRVFYWTMGILIAGTFLPSALFLMLYVFTGERECVRRAQLFWNFTRVLALFGANVLIWGHVVVGLWSIWFG